MARFKRDILQELTVDLMNRISIGNPEMKPGEKLKREVRTVTSLVRKKERRGLPFSYI
ncbi:hypothetical protein NC653_002713 [Populus alba x Populus x berolinensis]|uniref:Uncharacterized protein n=1 Tax=Populus alba x Populus x berolinensis TaxID=444605 RepID=A0AAD6RPH0_9ROSI|nr:hypothetical protein NC653_002713 [Populus alba x Populus x berolinensis]